MRSSQRYLQRCRWHVLRNAPMLDIRVDLHSLRLDQLDRLVLLEDQRRHLRKFGSDRQLDRRYRTGRHRKLARWTHILHHLRELRDRLLNLSQVLVARLHFGEGSASALRARRDELQNAEGQ